VSFDHVLPFPRQVVEPGVTLQQLERRVHDRAALVVVRVAGTERGWRIRAAVGVAGRAGLGALEPHLFDAL